MREWASQPLSRWESRRVNFWEQAHNLILFQHMILGPG